MTVNLGDRVKDRLTGFEGVATGKHEYMYGCTRFTVSPTTLSDKGYISPAESFDELQLEVIEAGAFQVEVDRPKRTRTKTGGPRDDPHKAVRSEGR